MANPQLENGFLGIARDIQNELILRDFSLRQRQIIDLILRLSWGCQKKYAVISTYTKYFTQILGIKKQNIRKELDQLVKNKVIFWDKNLNVFIFNKDYDQWCISYPKECNPKALKEIIEFNLKSNIIDYSVIQDITQSNPEYYSVISERLLEQSGNINIEQEEGTSIYNINKQLYTDKNKQQKNKANKTKPPYKEIKDLYNNICSDLSKITTLGDKREKLINKAWKEFPDIENWKVIFKFANTKRWNLTPPNDKPNFNQIFEKDRYIEYFEQGQKSKPDEMDSLFEQLQKESA